jgi:hypothetical protein
MTNIASILHVPPDDLKARLQALGDGMTVTSGSFALKTTASPLDLNWNHMDPHHRPYVHRTYGNSLRLCTGDDFQFSVTKFGPWPIFIQVADACVRPGLFYQCFSLFNVVIIVCVISTGEHGAQIDWHIASPRVWRFLHPYLSRRLERLNRVQGLEDESIRQRRTDLRRRGYTFRCGGQTFVEASSLEHNLVPPRLRRQHEVAVKLEGTSGRPGQFSVEELDFLYLGDGSGGIQLWPAVCPHEGGPLAESLIPAETGRVKCPWHGLEFGCLHLTAAKPEGTCLGTRIRLQDGKLMVSPGAAGDPPPRPVP